MKSIHIVCLSFSLLLATQSIAAQHHPRHLMHVAPGVMAAGLYRSEGGRHHGHKQAAQRRRELVASQAYQGQRMQGYGLGIYTINLIFNGYTINALVDTGSGIPQLACNGATVDPSPKFWNQTAKNPVSVFNPDTATPPFTLIPQWSAKCQTFCSSSYYGTCSTNPTVAGSCEVGTTQPSLMLSSHPKG